MSFDEEHLDEHYECQLEVAERDARIRELAAILRDIEPYLDSLICYASTINEHFPNGFPARVRAALAQSKIDPPQLTRNSHV